MTVSGRGSREEREGGDTSVRRPRRQEREGLRNFASLPENAEAAIASFAFVLWRMRREDVDSAPNEAAAQVVDSAFAVRRRLGIGLLESVYVEALRLELSGRGLGVRTQVPIEASFNGVRLGTAFRADMVVEDRVIVEVKAVEALRAEHSAQLLTYLRLSGRPLGLLVNFNEPVLKKGIRRKVMSASLLP